MLWYLHVLDKLSIFCVRPLSDVAISALVVIKNENHLWSIYRVYFLMDVVSYLWSWIVWQFRGGIFKATFFVDAVNAYSEQYGR